MPTDARRIQFILDHIKEWENLPRPEGMSVCEPKVCLLHVTPYQRQPHNDVMRALLLSVIDYCIAFEDAKDQNLTGSVK